jgi:hypothetical protein
VSAPYSPAIFSASGAVPFEFGHIGTRVFKILFGIDALVFALRPRLSKYKQRHNGK